MARSDLIPHPTQWAFWQSAARFIVCAAGRRSGKTMIAKTKLVTRAVEGPPESWYVAGAPTFRQAKRIFWADLKRLCRPFLDGKPSESELEIRLFNGSRITVLGLERPERIEGANRLQGVVIDEFANVKDDAWPSHIQPALADRGLDIPGWAILFGVPEGRNHFYELSLQAQDSALRDWAYFHWVSADILLPAEIEQLRATLDVRTFQREFEAAFLDFAGRAYYAFQRESHVSSFVDYDPTRPLLLAFDFNVNPGVAQVCQELTLKPGRRPPGAAEHVLAVIDEVHEQDSNTPLVCSRLLERWGARHRNHEVLVYGDATGGARGTAKVEGSDWALIKKHLGKVWDPGPRGQLRLRVGRKNPPERVRLNALNARLMSADNEIHLLLHPRCEHTIRDLEATMVKPDGSLDKTSDPQWTHHTDALGYLVAARRPLVEKRLVEQSSWSGGL